MGRKSNYLQRKAGFFGENFGKNFYGERYWESLDFNERWFMQFRWQIATLAQKRFRWINLPSTCDARFLELTLFYQGRATIAYPQTQKGVFYSTQAAENGRPNIYGYPSRWRSIGVNGWQFNVTPANGVYIYDNSQRWPIASICDLYARELTDIQRTMQVNRFHQKIPLVITADQDKVLDLTNIAKQVGGGEPMILGYDSLRDVNAETLTDKPAPFIGGDLVEAQKYVWQQVYETLGVPNLTFKTERMIEDEVSTQESPSKLMLLDALNERRKAADALNRRFGKYLTRPIKVEFNTDWESDMYNDTHNFDKLAELEGGASDNADV